MNEAHEEPQAAPQQALRKIRELLLLATVAFLPLVVAPGLMLDGYNAPKLTLLLVATSLAAALKAIEGIWTRSPIGFPPLAWPALFIAVPMTLAWLLSPYRGWALFGLYTRLQGLLPYLAVVALGMLLADAFRARVQPLIGAMAFAGAGVGAYATYQMLFLGSTVDSYSTSDFVTSTLGHSNFAGGFLAITLPFALFLWLNGGRWKWAGTAATILIIDGLLFTFSQGGWLAGIAGSAIVLWLRLRGNRPTISRLALLVASITAATPVFLVVIASVLPRLARAYPALLETVRIRGFLWRSGIDMFLDRPFTGWGPNAYAWRGLAYRLQEEALMGGSKFFGDDPHSVPISFAANAGLPGLIGLLAVAVWTVRRVMGTRVQPLTTAFAGGAAAYFVQSLGSLDEISLRVGLWVCLAGIWATTTQPAAAPPVMEAVRKRKGYAAIAVRSMLVVTAVTFAAWSVQAVAIADVFARRGGAALVADNVNEGRAYFQRALSFREEPYYQRVMGELLGAAAVEMGKEGAPLIAEMGSLLDPLDRAGDPLAAASQARLLHAWSIFDPSVDLRALALFQRARIFDRHNPSLAVGQSDVLMALGRPTEAIEVLRPFAEVLSKKFPHLLLSGANRELWGGLAIAHAKAGDPASAREAIEVSNRIPGQDCRTLIATELVKPPEDQERPLALSFICPQVLIELLPAGSSTRPAP